MARTRKQFVKIPLNGKTLLIITLYSAMLMCLGGMLKACNNDANEARAKIANSRIR